METRCVVPIIDISFCLGSRARSSLLYVEPIILTSSASNGPLVSTDIIPEYFTAIAFTFLLRRTVPIPPLPACLNRCVFLAESYQETLCHPISVCSGPGPAATTDTERGLPSL